MNKRSITNKFDSMTSQAKLVFLAALAPVVLALAKFRYVDAIVLALSGVLSVYNMTCLSSGRSCTTWAWILSVSYAAMVVFELTQESGPTPEFLKSEEQKKEEAAPVSELEAEEEDADLKDEML